MEITDEIWGDICRLFSDAFKHSLHCTIATVSEDGVPRATPIGSLILGRNRRGFYFEEYVSGLAKNLRTNKRVCVLAVNSHKPLFFKMLLFGEFTEPIAVRLVGTAGEKREALPEETALFRKRVSPYRMLKGHDMLWGNLRYVRDITFDSFEPVRLGPA
ncbi:MAG: pyridoxamine 5'-phosphate oxidase family protein [Pseudomonadota bacterium]